MLRVTKQSYRLCQDWIEKATLLDKEVPTQMMRMLWENYMHIKYREIIAMCDLVISTTGEDKRRSLEGSM